MPWSHDTAHAGGSRENEDSTMFNTEKQGAAASGSYATVGNWPLSKVRSEHTSYYFQSPAEMLKEV